MAAEVGPGSARLLPVGEPEVARLTLPDGVDLVADVYRPIGAGQLPVLLMRQPYGRRIASTVVLAHPAWYAARGYVVVVQDVRGRGDSGGQFRPLEDDAADGAATLAWAADLAGGDGRVATYGFSYQATNQLLALAGAGAAGSKRPDAIVAAMGAWTVRDDWVFESGAFRLAGSQIWACQMAAENARLAGDAVAVAELAAAAGSGPWNGPVAGRPEVLARYDRYTHYAGWLADDPRLWSAMAPAAALAEHPLDVPALHVGGWQDFLLEGTLGAHAAFAGRGNARQELLIGPWLHLPWGRRIGEIDFGPAADLSVDAAACAFLDRALNDRDDAASPVRLFDIGRRAWRSFDVFPDPAPSSLFLTSTGLAATTAGADGALLPDPAAAGADRLVHDPWRPAPAVGGALGTPAGYVDRSAVDGRGDVAVYTTPPLQQPLDLVGRIAAELHVESDLPSFDVHAAVSVVRPDGSALTLSCGHLRIGDAGDPEVRRVRLRPVCCTLEPGTALRLSLQAAAWPAFAVNPGTGRSAEEVPRDEAAVTTLTIRHGGAHPSRLLLPALG